MNRQQRRAFLRLARDFRAIARSDKKLTRQLARLCQRPQLKEAVMQRRRTEQEAIVQMVDRLDMLARFCKHKMGTTAAGERICLKCAEPAEALGVR